MLTVGAAAVELGVPAACLLGWVRRPEWRPKIVVALGAVAPWMCLYAATLATWLVTQTREGLWAVLAMWVMSFFLYVPTLVVATLLAWVPRPRALAWRAIGGMLATLAIIGAATFGLRPPFS